MPNFLQKLQIITQTEPQNTKLYQHAQMLLKYLTIQKWHEREWGNRKIDYSQSIPEYKKEKSKVVSFIKSLKVLLP